MGLSEKQTTNILILAGGTGGHIIPGIALAKEFSTRLAATPSQVLLLSSLRNKDFADFSDSKLRIEFYDPPKIPTISKSFLKIPLFFWQLFFAYKKAKTIFKKFSIDAVVGMGGYTSLPALLAARFSRIPYYLCEQNAVPGRATRLFARHAQQIYLGVPIDSFLIPKKKCLLTGNPIKPGLLCYLHLPERASQQQAPKTKPSQKKFEVLVLGGSQGALQLNRMCEEIIKNRWISNANWSIQCGKEHLKNMQALLPKKDFSNVKLFGYHPNIANLLERADVLVCRAGAGILSEGVLFGLPMILVPYPYAQDDHQLANARYYEAGGAAFVIASKEVESQKLCEKIKKLKDNPALRKKMQERSKSLARPDAAAKIAEELLKNLNASKTN